MSDSWGGVSRGDDWQVDGTDDYLDGAGVCDD